MAGWTSVDTARCEACAIYTPKQDIVFGQDGRPYCVQCGAPPYASTASDARPQVLIPPAYRSLIQDHVRVVVAAILLVALAFPIAACVSQL